MAMPVTVSKARPRDAPSPTLFAITVSPATVKRVAAPGATRFWFALLAQSVISTQAGSAGIRQAAGALTGAAAGRLAVSALSISSIVRPRVSKPMKMTAISARMYQLAK